MSHQQLVAFTPAIKIGLLFGIEGGSEAASILSRNSELNMALLTGFYEPSIRRPTEPLDVEQRPFSNIRTVRLSLKLPNHHQILYT